MATKVCEVCGKKFQSNYKRQIYCSSACRKIGDSQKQSAWYYKRLGKPKPKEKICAVCGKPIEGKGRFRYCSKLCADKGKFELTESCRKKVVRRKNETLCWTCQNACCGCSWSKSFTPVEGWEAKPSEDSFFVINCPQFIPDEER